MPFTADEIININNAALELYIDQGTVHKQFVTNKPMLKAMEASAGSFSGGNEFISFAVKAGQGGGSLKGYTHDDQVDYYNPTGIKRARVRWYEHHIGLTYTFTELKRDGIEVTETNASQRTSEISGREKHALANILDEKMDTMGEDYASSKNLLLWGDGSGDAKAVPGIQSFILANPAAAGSTFGLSRVANPWWANDAATAAFGSAGGRGAITSTPSNGGALIEAMDQAKRRRSKYADGAVNTVYFAGSDFIDAYKRELRANGNYTMTGWRGKTPDGSMEDPSHNGTPFTWDPTLDDLGLAKRCYALDTGRNGLKVYYLNGKAMQRHNPARPYDRYVVYNGVTCTMAFYAKRLNTSGVYDIA
jgi:hypothetical protein